MLYEKLFMTEGYNWSSYKKAKTKSRGQSAEGKDAIMPAHFEPIVFASPVMTSMDMVIKIILNDMEQRVSFLTAIFFCAGI